MINEKKKKRGRPSTRDLSFPDKELASKIKKLIMARGLKIVHVSNELGMNATYFSLLINGHKIITPGVKERLAEYLSVEL